MPAHNQPDSPAPHQSLADVCRAMLGDYQTSAVHHPQHVLVRLDHFESMRVQLELED